MLFYIIYHTRRVHNYVCLLELTFACIHVWCLIAFCQSIIKNDDDDDDDDDGDGDACNSRSRLAELDHMGNYLQLNLPPV